MLYLSLLFSPCGSIRLSSRAQMGKKNKLTKFAEIGDFPNVYQRAEEMKGKWQTHFPKEQPLVLELACGKGEYTIGLAEMYPNRNYIGLDIKGNRIWKGARKGLDENISNAAFLRCEINLIESYFEEGEIDEIWITFPDPQHRKGKAKHRLIHPRFLDKYRKVGKKPLTINLKTDSTRYYKYCKEVIEEQKLQVLADSDDVYAWADRPAEINIRTFYESMWLDEGKKIKYLKFVLA